MKIQYSSLLSKRAFGSLMSGKTAKCINYTEINRKRIYEREKIRVKNKKIIRDFENESSKDSPTANIKGLMHYTNVTVDNNPSNSHIYKLLNPIAKLRISKLGTRPLVAVLLYYVENWRDNHTVINQIIKEVIRRFYEFDSSEMAHIAYSLTFLDKLKYFGLIENFANRVLLLGSWNFNFAELAKILYFSVVHSNTILFEKSLINLTAQGKEANSDVHIFSAHLISKSLGSVDPRLLTEFYNLLDSITKISVDILENFIGKFEGFLYKNEENRVKNVVYDIDVHDLETLELGHLIPYLANIIKLGYNNYDFITKLNDYISKLLCIGFVPAAAESSTKKITHSSKYPVHAFIAYYLKSKRKKASFPDFNILLQLIKHVKPTETIAKKYIKMLGNISVDMPIHDILYANTELLYDNIAVNDTIANILPLFREALGVDLSESSDYVYYKLFKAYLGVDKIGSITMGDVDSFMNTVNSQLKVDGDYRFLIRNSDKVLKYCIFALSSSNGSSGCLPSILSITTEIAWAFPLSQIRRLLRVLFDNMRKISTSDILTRNCFYRLFNVLLKSQIPLFNIHHKTYQLYLVYNLIEYNEVIKESTKDIDIQIDNHVQFAININSNQPIGPLVASSWFSKLSGLEREYSDIDYGLNAYKKIELCGHPLKRHSIDTLFEKSKDVLNGRYEDNEFSRFISNKSVLLRDIVEGALRFVQQIK